MSSTFHLFPTLPPELRLKIWTYALPNLRTMILRSTTSLPHHPFSRTPESEISLCSPKLETRYLHALLSTCKDSNTIVQLHYKPLFLSRNQNPQPITYFNPKIDTLYISNSRALTALHRSPLVLLLDQIRNLALFYPYTMVYDGSYQFSRLAFVFSTPSARETYLDTIASCTKLKVLAFVDQGTRGDGTSDYEVSDGDAVALLMRLRGVMEEVGISEEVSYGENGDGIRRRRESLLGKGVRLRVLSEEEVLSGP